MLFVPVISPATTQPPSPRARELADLLTRVMEEYERAHPAITTAEVRHAMRLAEERTGGGPARTRVAVIALVGFVMSLVLVTVLALLSAG
jgi:hypothetical protein